MIKLAHAKNHARAVIENVDFITKVQHTIFTETKMSSNEIAQHVTMIPDLLDTTSILIWKPKWYSPYKNKVVGWTKGEDIHINSNFYVRDSYDVPKLANTLSHELLHILGYSHSRYDSYARRNSVPYKIGLMIEEWEL